MKKLIKMTIAIVLVVSMAFVTFGYSYDSAWKEKQSLRDTCLSAKNISILKSDDITIDNLLKKTIDKDVMNQLRCITTFGNYPQTGTSNMSKQPIEWIVLDNSGGKLLLMSKNVLFYDSYIDWQKCYSIEDKNEMLAYHDSCNWDNCYLRQYLNSTFINDAFNSVEQSYIVPYSVTGDKVFILSLDEANAYFNLNDLNYQWVYDYAGLTEIYKYKGNPWTMCEATNYAMSIANSLDAKYNEFRNKKNGNSHKNSQALRDFKFLDFKGYSVCENLFFNEGRKEPTWSSPSPSGWSDTNKNKASFFGIRPCVWVAYDENVKSAREQELESLVGGIGKTIIGGALDSVLPGSSLLIP